MLIYRFVLLWCVAALLGSTGAFAATVDGARYDAIFWLEGAQHADGSWGDGEKRPLVTAEVLNALAVAGRGDTTVAPLAANQLINQGPINIDYYARALRALAAAGVDVESDATSLKESGANANGWGVTSAVATPNSYDTALVLGAIQAVLGEWAPEDVSMRDSHISIVAAGRRGDNGWSGDGIPVESGASDLTVTAETVRALADVPNTVGTLDVVPALLSSPTSVSSSTSTLELAARLAALHAMGQVGGDVSTVETDGSENTTRSDLMIHSVT